MLKVSQIKAKATKVKNGVNSTITVSEMNEKGVLYYEHYVNNGRVVLYKGGSDIELSEPQYSLLDVADTSSEDKLVDILPLFRQGKIDYITFCKKAALAGVQKWVLNAKNFICTYYDKKGGLLVIEKIPN
ncbi:MAG: hypothetical protein RL662_1851 [Bacteroidota bacterium]|jgi:uncharacterized protein YbcV (DUF1398 family)